MRAYILRLKPSNRSSFIAMKEERLEEEALFLIESAEKQEAWFDEQTRIPRESEIEAAVKQEAWFDEQTQIPREEYHNNYRYRLDHTREYGIFLPRSAPNCDMTTTFSDLCDPLCERLDRAHYPPGDAF